MSRTKRDSAPKAEKCDPWCRWVLGAKYSRKLLKQGDLACLLVWYDGGFSRYWIAYGDRDGELLVNKEQDDGRLKTYTLQMFDEDDPQWWQCDCGDFVHRRMGRSHCKHLRSVAVALKAIADVQVYA